MKNTVKTKGSITKPLLAGLVIPTLSEPKTSKIEAEKASFSKTTQKQSDLAHDPGNGYNPDFTFLQD